MNHLKLDTLLKFIRNIDSKCYQIVITFFELIGQDRYRHLQINIDIQFKIEIKTNPSALLYMYTLHLQRCSQSPCSSYEVQQSEPSSITRLNFDLSTTARRSLVGKHLWHLQVHIFLKSLTQIFIKMYSKPAPLKMIVFDMPMR